MQIAGIDADSIVSQLMAIEERPLTALQARKDAAKVASDAISKIRSKVDAYRLAADRLVTSSTFARHQATVSNTDAVTASVSTGAAPVQLSFTVDQLAQAHGLRSVGTVASPNVVITSEPALALTAGTGGTGVDTVRAQADLTAGTYTVNVTQAAGGASTVGTAPLDATTNIGLLADSLSLNVGGTAHSISIAWGSYTPENLVTAVQAALDADGVAATAALDENGALAITTDAVGSAATIQVTGGSARTSLQLGTAASTGTDGTIEVNGVTTNVVAGAPGSTISVATGSGTLDLTLSGPLEVGQFDVRVIDTGDGSLEDVVTAINGANAGMSAAAVKVGDAAYRLQLTASATGTANALTIDTGSFAGIGGLVESAAARNAVLTIGSGPGAYQVEASGNTFTDILPGVTLTAKQTTTTPVDVSVTRNDAAIADDVANLVTKINELLAEIKVQTRADPATGTSGPLSGNSTIRRLADTVRSALADQVAGLATSLPADVGIQRDRDGSFTFDRAAFLTAIEDDHEAVTRLFTRGGTDTGPVTFAAAGSFTTSGSYDVVVTTAATRAASGTLFAGGAGADARVGVRIGDTTVTVDVAGGQSAAQIIDAMNAAFASAGLDVVAEADGTGLTVRADAWGSDGDFELNTDVLGAGTWSEVAGTDVAGTIDGVLATGQGRLLSLAANAETRAAGLSVEVDGGATGALGSVEYLPGLAARVVEVASALTQADSGVLTNAKEAADRRIEDFNDQIGRLEDRLVIREVNLRRQWASFQSLLAGLQNQGNWLSGQLANLGGGSLF